MEGLLAVVDRYTRWRHRHALVRTPPVVVDLLQERERGREGGREGGRERERERDRDRERAREG